MNGELLASLKDWYRGQYYPKTGSILSKSVGWSQTGGSSWGAGGQHYHSEEGHILLGCRSSRVASRSRELIVPFHLAYVRWHLEQSVQFCDQYEKDIDKLEWVDGHQSNDQGPGAPEGVRAGFFQPEDRCRGATAVCNCLLGGCRKDRSCFFSYVQRARTRGNVHKLGYRKF